jgi:WD40 repeat protein
MTFTPDGADLAVADGTNVILYHTLSRQEAGLLTPRNPGLREIAIAPNGSWLVAGSLPGYQAGVPSTYLERWRGPEWRPAGVFAVSPLGLSDLAFRPDGWELAVSYSDPDESKNQVDLWDLFTWGISSTLTPGAVLDLAYSPDGALLALSPDRYAVNVWDLSDLAKPLYTVHTSFTGAINDLTFSPDGSLLATGGYDGEIRLYDAQSGNLALVIPGDAAVGSMAFSPDGSLIASGGIYDDSLVRLWDARSGALLRTLEGHRSGVSELQFSPDSRMLASASYDGTLRLWGIRP